MRVAVVGCGIFGAVAALRLAESGHDVVVIEREGEPLRGVTANNQRRLHLGFHYPRDEETARQSVRGYRRFCEAFPESIVRVEPNAYFVARCAENRTSAEAYRRFVARLGVPGELFDVGLFRPAVRDVEMGIAVSEAVYDVERLREGVSRALAGVSRIFNMEVVGVARRGAKFEVHFRGGSLLVDAVVNCTYADVNRFGGALGHVLKTYQYERTAVAVVEWDERPVGITVVDGDFGMTVLPVGGESGKFLLYHVEHSVLAREVGKELPPAWRRAPGAARHWGELMSPSVFETMREACSRFVPSLRAARLIRFLQSSRIVLADQDATDARPSIVSAPESRFVNVLAGKVDHCLDAADEVVSTLGAA